MAQAHQRWSPDGTLQSTSTMPDHLIEQSGGLADLSDWLDLDATMPSDGEADASTLLQTAVDALGDLYDSDGIPRQLFVPAGQYRLDSAVEWRSGVGLKGAGRHETVLLPYGDITAITGVVNTSSQPVEFFDDCVFEDFTIDAANQVVVSSAGKGIYIQSMRRARFERVRVLNASWTGFGLDYLQDVWFVDCYAEGNGRLDTSKTSAGAGSSAGAGAGFGIATGWFDTESCTIINCVAVDNGTHGFFTENKNTGPTTYSKGFRLVGCYASGNYIGFCDAGSTGAVVSGCTFEGNVECGVKIGRTGANSNAGVRGVVVGCSIIGNGTDDGSITVNLCGVQIREAANGGYSFIGNEIEGNGRFGIYAGGASVLGEGFTFKGNRIHGHPRSGVRIVSGSTVPRLDISHNEIVNNGQDSGAGSTQRDGITIGSACTRLTIRGNRCYDTQGTKTQLYGVALRGSESTVVPVIMDNDLRDNKTGGLLNEHTVADTTYVADNIT